MDDLLPPVVAAVGATFSCDLRCFGGSGTIWSVPVVPAGLRLSGEEQMEADPTPGGSMIQRFTFTVQQPGRYELVFTLGRPWEKIARHRVSVLVTTTG